MGEWEVSRGSANIERGGHDILTDVGNGYFLYESIGVNGGVWV